MLGCMGAVLGDGTPGNTRNEASLLKGQAIEREKPESRDSGFFPQRICRGHTNMSRPAGWLRYHVGHYAS